MNRFLATLFTFTLFSAAVFAQKIPLNNDVYDRWKSLYSPSVSDDGKWVIYEINLQQGREKGKIDGYELIKD